MKTFTASLLIYCLTMFSGCGGGSPSAPPATPSVAVVVSPTSVNLIAGGTQQFSATVRGSSNTGVAWSLNSSGCSGAACGTITSTGMYTAPSPVPSSIAVSVVATAAADTTKSASATANLIPISVAISPATGSVYQRDMMQFMASVNGTTNNAVTWDVDGYVGGSCSTGYVWPSGLYTTSYCDIYNPPQTYTVRATSTADSTKFATAQVTVTGPAPKNARMNGEYAFLFRGYDNDGPAVVAGRFSADGAGGIIAGEVALNSVSSTIVMSASGNYSIGNDNRGTMYLSNWIFRFVIDSEGKMRIIDFDQTLNNPIRGSGEIKEQDSTAFSLNAFNGSFALGLTGDLNGSAMALLGQLTSDTSGTVSGATDQFTPTAILANLATTGTLLAPDALLGSGSFTITPVGTSVSTPLNFEYFVVSATEAYVVQVTGRSASVPVLSGVMLKQSGGPFDNSLLNAATVMQLSGPTSGGSHAILAQAVFNGGGLLSGLTDDNHAGGIVANESFTGNYTVASNGRGTANIFLNSGGSTSFTFYLVNPSRAFIVGGTPASPVGEVVAGNFEAQSGAPYTTASMAGSYAAGSLAPPTASVPNVTAEALLSSGGTFSGALDTCTVVGCALSQSLNGTINITDTTAGRGTVTAGSLSGASAFYIVSPTKVWMLNSMVTGDNAAAIIGFEQ